MRLFTKKSSLLKSPTWLALGFCAFMTVSWTEAQVTRRKTTTTKPTTQTNTDLKKAGAKDVPQMTGVVTYIAPIEPFEYLISGSPTEVGGRRELLVVSDLINDSKVSQSQPLSDKNTANLFCKRERLNLESKIRQFEEMPLGARPDWLKPGIVLNVRSFLNGTYDIEQRYERSPITISTSDLRGAINSAITVSNPKNKSNIATAENQLISQNADPLSANMTLKFTEIKSQEDLSFKLNGRYSGSLGSFSSSIGVEAGSQKSYHYYLVEFTQFMFSLDVDGLDEATIFQTSQPVSTEDYIYISKVNYGRRGGILFKSKSSLQSLMAKLNISTGFSAISQAQLSSFYQQAKSNSEVEIHAYMYGGSSQGAAESIVNTLENGRPEIGKWITSQPANHKLALPIGFEIKNLQNQQVGMTNSIRQDIETCVEKRNYRLKMTLTDIQNVDGRDGGGDDPDDYGLQMGVVLKARNKALLPSESQFNKFSGAPCGFTSPGRKNISGPYACWIGGGMNTQIHVRENRVARDLNQIVNSMTFNLSWEDYQDPKNELRIYTWLKEYTGSNDRVIHDDDILVPLQELLDILAGNKPLEATKTYPDGQIAQGGMQFHDFGPRTLMLTEASSTGGRYILEGPIKAGKAGEKAAVWVRFELVD